ncbi:hypothetical protein AQ1_02297 [alpha proteobacterium Q-1]|uniref:HNH endonuclease n=1 Tax=Iodidimonas nitroreducens TaxID=1236968 RepID=UPI0004A04004|nr:HNH endonuclease [Iodidimonas nitroreducens]GAK34399.1 hypothetical protein AQ1_02297 [alpha proteobacterium Q-1]
MTNRFDLRPAITNPALWWPKRPPRAEWNRIRRTVLERDDYTCSTCEHRAIKNMHVHHLAHSDDNAIDNLITICVACHAVLHFGRSITLGVIEIWNCPLPQAEIVQQTRMGIARGLSLETIKQDLQLGLGPHPPASDLYANELIEGMGSAPRAYLPEPLKAIFVSLKQWQINPSSS